MDLRFGNGHGPFFTGAPEPCGFDALVCPGRESLLSARCRIFPGAFLRLFPPCGEKSGSRRKGEGRRRRSRLRVSEPPVSVERLSGGRKDLERKWKVAGRAGFFIVCNRLSRALREEGAFLFPAGFCRGSTAGRRPRGIGRLSLESAPGPDAPEALFYPAAKRLPRPGRGPGHGSAGMADPGPERNGKSLSGQWKKGMRYPDLTFGGKMRNALGLTNLKTERVHVRESV